MKSTYANYSKKELVSEFENNKAFVILLKDLIIDDENKIKSTKKNIIGTSLLSFVFLLLAKWILLVGSLVLVLYFVNKFHKTKTDLIFGKAFLQTGESVHEELLDRIYN